jgi:hypothetical protein
VLVLVFFQVPVFLAIGEDLFNPNEPAQPWHMSSDSFGPIKTKNLFKDFKRFKFDREAPTKALISKSDAEAELDRVFLKHPEFGQWIPTIRAYLRTLCRLKPKDIAIIHQNPSAVLIPLWRVYQEYISSRMDGLRMAHHLWINDTRTSEVDEIIFKKWTHGQQLIEEFEYVSGKLEDLIRDCQLQMQTPIWSSRPKSSSTY